MTHLIALWSFPHPLHVWVHFIVVPQYALSWYALPGVENNWLLIELKKATACVSFWFAGLVLVTLSTRGGEPLRRLFAPFVLSSVLWVLVYLFNLFLLFRNLFFVCNWVVTQEDPSAL